MTEFSKVREMLDRLLLLDIQAVSPQQYEEASHNASLIREKYCKFQQRVADKTYSATMAQKVSAMEQDVAKLDTLLDNARSSADELQKVQGEQQRLEEAAQSLARAVGELCSQETSVRSICLSEEQQERKEHTRIEAEGLVLCRRMRSERLKKEREEMKVQAQLAEEHRLRIVAAEEEMQRQQREEEARKTREQDRIMKKRRMEAFLQQHRRVPVEELMNSSVAPIEFEFRPVDQPTPDVASGTDVPPPASDADTEQLMIDEALEVSLRSLGTQDVQDPFNKKPEVQG